ncbi:hypothetical protein Nepgr_032141 [Nepenthes gracilis]|uniref:Uncharacterized protein n=1 Tax=Nepenthes gracilis TaxID=150966 RepID=A0AAD3Y5U2_NEPGR|nr:hypothetical protein Nepgr_032141 [Nepenthes gracilis]
MVSHSPPCEATLTTKVPYNCSSTGNELISHSSPVAELVEHEDQSAITSKPPLSFADVRPPLGPNRSLECFTEHDGSATGVVFGAGLTVAPVLLWNCCSAVGNYRICPGALIGSGATFSCWSVHDSTKLSPMILTRSNWVVMQQSKNLPVLKLLVPVLPKDSIFALLLLLFCCGGLSAKGSAELIFQMMFAENQIGNCRGWGNYSVKPPESGAGQNDARETMRFDTGAKLLVSVVFAPGASDGCDATCDPDEVSAAFAVS